MTTRAAAQAAQERHSALVLEIDADSCTNAFGASPCTAGRVQAAQTAQAATPTSLTLSTIASAVADVYKNTLVNITGGAGAGQERTVLTSRKNLVNYSNFFNSNGWSLSGGVTPVQDSIDPNGIANSAWTVTIANTDSGIYKPISAVKCRNSIWMRAKSGTPQIYIENGSTQGSNLVTLSTAWKRYSSNLSAADYFEIRTDLPVQIPSVTIEIFGAQSEDVDGLANQFASEYIHTIANTAVGIAADSQWSSNLLLQSEALNVTPWGGTSVSSTPLTYGTSPFWSVAKLASGGSESLSSGWSYSVPSGQPLTVSVALLAGNSSQVSVGLYGGTDNWGPNGSSLAAIISGPGTLTQALGGLWIVTGLSQSNPTLLSITRTYQVAEANYFLIYPDTHNSTTIGASNLVTRAQVEIGSVVSAYIKTTTAAVLLPDATSIYDLIDRPNACNNTYGTCKDKIHYAKGVKTFKFCSRGMAIPAGEPLRPYITAHAFTPTEIPIGGGLAARSQTTLTMADEVCSDIEADQYAAVRSSPASGTFWTRFIARNYNIQGRIARVRKGYITSPFDWTVFQTELYMIESIIGPDSSGNVQIVLADITKTLDKNMLPVATSGKLAAALKAIEYQGTVVSADATHVTLDAKASAVDGYYVSMEIYLTQNTGAGQRRVISAYVGATRVATVAAWTVNPDNTTPYQISALNVNVGTGNGAQYADPVATGLPQYIRLGKEVIRYTAIAGDVLSWPDSTYRAQFGTAAADAKIGDSVQLCFAPVAQSVTAVIHRLANAAGIADAYIDLIGLAAEDTSWYGTPAIITACIHTPEKASALLNELLATINLCAWWDVVAQQLKFKADMPQMSSTVVALTPSETISKSLQVTPLDTMRISRSFMAFAPFSATENMTQSTNFSIINGKIDAAAESAVEYNNVISEQRYSRWMSAANALFVAGLVARRVSRLRDAPFKMAFTLDPRNEVHLGDLIDVSSRKKTDSTGAPLVTRMRVTKYLDNQNIDIEAISTNFANRYAFIQSNGNPDYSAATAAQRQYAFIAANTELMSDGSNAYLIS